MQSILWTVLAAWLLGAIPTGLLVFVPVVRSLRADGLTGYLFSLTFSMTLAAAWPLTLRVWWRQRRRL